MFTKKRPDGTYIRDIHFLNQIMPYLLPTKVDATIYFEYEFDVTKAIEFARKKKGDQSAPKITLFYIILYASLRTIAQRPKLNRFISGYRFYQRNSISFTFVAKRSLTDDGEEFTVTISASPLISLDDFCKKIHEQIFSLRKGASSNTEKLNSFVARLPRPLIKFVVWVIKFLDYHNALPKSAIDAIPFFTTVFFANLGSVGVEAVYHHNYEIGNCGLFVTIGKARKETCLKPDGTTETRDKVKMRITYDDRIVDGIYCARAIEIIRNLVENPEQLEIPLELTDEQLAELALSEKC